MKVSKPVELEPLGFIQLIAACLKYAALVEQEHGKLNAYLIEEIDLTANRLLNNTASEQGVFTQRISSLNYHWSSALSGGRANSTFLSFAIRFRLDSFVAWKLNQIQLDQTELSALLHSAVVDFDSLPNFGPYALSEQSTRNMELIKELVKKGASPYEQFDGLSAYETVAEDIHVHDHDRISLLKLFKRYVRRKLASASAGREASGNNLSAEQVHGKWAFKDDLVPTRPRRGSNESIYLFSTAWRANPGG